MKIIDDFLNENDFTNIQSTLMNDPSFPWYYNPSITYDKDINDKNSLDYQFTHLFYLDHSVRSSYYSVLIPILKKVAPLSIIRIKANLNPFSETQRLYGFHTDLEDDRVHTAIYYINTNNGPTKFENGESIDSVENRFVIFPSKERHSGISTNDTRCRVLINFNFVL